MNQTQDHPHHGYFRTFSSFVGTFHGDVSFFLFSTHPLIDRRPDDHVRTTEASSWPPLKTPLTVIDASSCSNQATVTRLYFILFSTPVTRTSTGLRRRPAAFVVDERESFRFH